MLNSSNDEPFLSKAIRKWIAKFDKEFDMVAIAFAIDHAVSCHSNPMDFDVQLFQDQPFRRRIKCNKCKRYRETWHKSS